MVVAEYTGKAVHIVQSKLLPFILSVSIITAVEKLFIINIEFPLRLRSPFGGGEIFPEITGCIDVFYFLL